MYLRDKEINDILTSRSFENRTDAITALVAHERGNADMTEALHTLTIDVWSVVTATAERGGRENSWNAAVKGKDSGPTREFICASQGLLARAAA